MVASKLDLPEEKLDTVMHIVRNSAVLMSLLDFLNRVYSERELNKTTSTNLAALFAPSFLRGDQETPLSLIANTKALTAIVELLVRHCACCQLTNEEGWQWVHNTATATVVADEGKDDLPGSIVASFDESTGSALVGNGIAQLEVTSLAGEGAPYLCVD